MFAVFPPLIPALRARPLRYLPLPRVSSPTQFLPHAHPLISALLPRSLPNTPASPYTDRHDTASNVCFPIQLFRTKASSSARRHFAPDTRFSERKTRIFRVIALRLFKRRFPCSIFYSRPCSARIIFPYSRNASSPRDRQPPFHSDFIATFRLFRLTAKKTGNPNFFKGKFAG